MVMVLGSITCSNSINNCSCDFYDRGFCTPPNKIKLDAEEILRLQFAIYSV
jgi:hypothetical protein